MNEWLNELSVTYEYDLYKCFIYNLHKSYDNVPSNQRDELIA